METIKTQIPQLPNETEPSERIVQIEVNEKQFWQIYIGLERLKLVPLLQKATNKLAREIHKIGKRHYKWV